MRMGATIVMGRLSPDLIQRAVRERFADFRKCYEPKLELNPKLTGAVIARFTITRDGTVNHVVDDCSDLPDADVVACSLNVFYDITFFPPEGGTVDVVYPMMFAPG
ncbi:MAG TPA: AgmX/PglI C-terminal domain-containing protein [Polyangiaceae bacterium]|nr:AgmX/PglI C-terminal domain-containing protein [Polyangiaceae bacterium]